MIVEEIMTKEIITLKQENTVKEALELLNRHNIRHIPIVNDLNHLVGIISDRDIRSAAPSILDENPDSSILEQSLKTIMSSPVITIHPLDFIEDVASIFYDHSIGCVPVVQDNKIVGVVTEKDLLYTLIQITGIHEQSSQIEVRVPNKVGVLPKVATVISERNTNISSVFIYSEKERPTEKVIVLRVQTMNPLPLINDLKEKGYDVLWPNIPGLLQ